MFNWTVWNFDCSSILLIFPSILGVLKLDGAHPVYFIDFLPEIWLVQQGWIDRGTQLPLWLNEHSSKLGTANPSNSGNKIFVDSKQAFAAPNRSLQKVIWVSKLLDLFLPVLCIVLFSFYYFSLFRKLGASLPLPVSIHNSTLSTSTFISISNYFRFNFSYHAAFPH